MPDGANVRGLLVAGNNLLAGTGNILYLSSNRGENWIRSSNGLDRFDIRDVVQFWRLT